MTTRGLLALALVVTTGCATSRHVDRAWKPPERDASGIQLNPEREGCFAVIEDLPDPSRPIGERVKVTHIR